MNIPEATDQANRINARAGRTASKAVRRAQLIDATIESISTHGISGTTMGTVTGYAGLSLGIVNFHFSSKENLFAETLRHLATEHRDLWRKTVKKANMPTAEKLAAIVDAQFHPQVCNHKKLTVWAAFYGEAGYRRSYRKIVSEIDAERWETSISLCARLIAEGSYDTVKPEEIAETLEGLFDGFWINILMYPGEFTAEHAKERVHQFLARTFPRHFPRPAAAAQGALS